MIRKVIVSIILVVTIIPFMFSQSAEGRYSSRLTRDGMIYFLMPEKIKELHELKKFEYDVTMLSWTDSVTINFTFEADAMSFPSDFEIKCDNEVLDCNNYSPLFTDIKKNHYEIRITSHFSIQQFETFIKSINPPVFYLVQDGKPETASYKPKAWNKDKKKLNDIFNLFLQSR